VAELYEPLAEEKGIALETDAPFPLPMRGNRELISQALANLVDNAIKYVSSGGTAASSPTIKVQATSQNGQTVLTVSDNGPGIPEAMRGKVIERFVRLEESRSVPGSGLGLSLVAAVARLHGGELRLESNEPGLRAILVLPRGDSQGGE
jgi:signal transduction histidine kinase